MEITEKIKERFCKDYSIPIKIFAEPYFHKRLECLDCLYNTLEKWNEYLSVVGKYSSEQDYFEYYNNVKDKMIEEIKSTTAYDEFNKKIVPTIINQGYPKKSIYNMNNNQQEFISIDMCKSNFNIMKKLCGLSYDRYENFVAKYTSNANIINSKYVRQVVFGNCNPAHQVAFQKVYMDCLLTKLLDKGIAKEDIILFTNDEIVFKYKQEYISVVEEMIGKSELPLRMEHFNICAIDGTNGFLKNIYLENGNIEIVLKGFSPSEVPFVIRALNNEPIKPEDLVFVNSDNRLAMYLTHIEIDIKKL